ncbi:thioesterase family protein [Alistipes sp. OttesenSCG-928-B03]|nr:thioesterase family protein [Alistipes sp. OttesenSCG-928-B03]
MEAGLKYTSATSVNSTNTAAAVGSGNLEVFATPAMIALMENAAMLAVANKLPEGSTTVGTLMNVAHVRATPVGSEVTAIAELQEVDGRKLIFHVSASDEKGLIGEGIHERAIVDIARFLDKINRVG